MFARRLITIFVASVLLLAGCAKEPKTLSENLDEQVKTLIQAKNNNDDTLLEATLQGVKRNCNAEAAMLILSRLRNGETPQQVSALCDMVLACHNTSTETYSALFTELLNAKDMEAQEKAAILQETLMTLSPAFIDSKIDTILKQAEEASLKSVEAAMMLIGEAEAVAPLAGKERLVAERKIKILELGTSVKARELALKAATALEEGNAFLADGISAKLEETIKNTKLKEEAKKLRNGLLSFKNIEDKHFEASIKAENLLKRLAELNNQIMSEESVEKKKELKKEAQTVRADWQTERGNIVVHIRELNRRRPQLAKIAQGYKELADKLNKRE